MFKIDHQTCRTCMIIPKTKNSDQMGYFEVHSLVFTFCSMNKKIVSNHIGSWKLLIILKFGY